MQVALLLIDNSKKISFSEERTLQKAYYRFAAKTHMRCLTMETNWNYYRHVYHFPRKNVRLKTKTIQKKLAKVVIWIISWLNTGFLGRFYLEVREIQIVLRYLFCWSQNWSIITLHQSGKAVQIHGNKPNHGINHLTLNCWLMCSLHPF